MISAESIWKDLEAIRNTSPLVHNITNYVVMNNTANALLAVGASPVMAHALEEAADMASLASSLVLNMGTLSPAWVEAMVCAGQKAKEKGIPLVFDPVGVGATAYRNRAAVGILQDCSPDIIRGNASEIMALGKEGGKTRGVDSTDSSANALETAGQLAKAHAAVVVISGEVDYITDGEAVCHIRNGSPLMPRVTGMGCTATALTAAFAAVNHNYLMAAAHAMAVMGIAGELAAAGSEGPGTLQLHFIDGLYALTYEQIKEQLRP